VKQQAVTSSATVFPFHELQCNAMKVSGVIFSYFFIFESGSVYVAKTSLRLAMQSQN
jgi:hypothetical protein